MANRLGVASSLKTKEGAYVPSLGLGSIGVSPLDMASAYATIAAGGIYSKPMAIRKVELPELDGDGWAVDKDANWGKPERQRVIADWVAAEVTEILEMNIQSGTGVGANIGRTAGGKTGTTENHADAWFCGITPTLSGTVWVGYPQAEIPMTSVHGISVAGGTFPAQIWRLFMEEAIGSTPERDFPEAQSEPIWHEFTRGEYAGEVPRRRTTTTRLRRRRPRRRAEQPAPPPPPSEPRARPAAAAAPGAGAAAHPTARPAAAAAAARQP